MTPDYTKPCIDVAFDILADTMHYPLTKDRYEIIAIIPTEGDKKYNTLAIMNTLEPLAGSEPTFDVLYNRKDIQEFANERGKNFRAMSSEKSRITPLFNYLFKTKITDDDYGLVTDNGRLFMNFDSNPVFFGKLMIRVI